VRRLQPRQGSSPSGSGHPQHGREAIFPSISEGSSEVRLEATRSNGRESDQVRNMGVLLSKTRRTGISRSERSCLACNHQNRVDGSMRVKRLSQGQSAL